MRRALLLALLALGCDGGGAPADAGIDAGIDAGRDAGVDAGPPVVVLPDDRAPCRDRDPLRRPFFGDLHVHTAVSFDANAYGTRTRPRDAYRFARGEAIGLPPHDPSGAPTRTVQLDRPLDFAAVTDHAEFFGEIDICSDPSSPGYDSTTCRTYREGDSAAPDYGELTNLLLMPRTVARVCRVHPELCRERDLAVWQEVQDAAEDFQDRTEACAFTTFVGYEWTGSAGGTNLHRNILFRGRSVQRVPVSYLDAPTPDELWSRLEATCLDTGTPCDLLSIPHNGNLGGGRMFVPTTEDGTPYDAAQAARRARLEPLLEIYQHKGASECVTGLDDPLASEDELCGFEMMHPNLCTGGADDPPDCVGVCAGGGIGFLGSCVGPSDMARGALRTGLREEARIGVDPFRFGFIGSTDTHVATSGLVREQGWPGHAGENEDEPADQLRVPDGALVRGLTASPGGLAVVWAEENSREALFDAMRRRETYATSGPRIVVRLFAGFGLPADLCDRADAIARGYEDGVPMGGSLGPDPAGAAPRLFVSALRDAMGAPLQRVQIVKGWLEGGETFERVYEVAGDADNGASVDEATCALSGDGFDALCEVWTDPDFDPAQPAFYYARVVENPTCRWSRHACNALDLDCASLPADSPYAACCDPAIAHTLQERAWTSPIWYSP
ncbi:MAG: DUF3604 domain-containing protein [Myxococcota bacterium]|nr:DUF3604 domain-containing protein [Myxococcota bacterium]